MSTHTILLLTLGFAIFYCCIGATIINTLLYIEKHVSEVLCEQLTLGLPAPSYLCILASLVPCTNYSTTTYVGVTKI